MKLHELMTPPGAVFAPATPLTTLVAALADQKLPNALICDQGKPVGRVPTSALLLQFAHTLQGQGNPHLTAQSMMVTDPGTASSELSLGDGIALLRAIGQERLAVVDKYGLLMGEVSHTTLLNQLLKISTSGSGKEATGQANHWLSLEDSLTGLPNRRAMEMDLRHAEAVAKRRNEPFTLALIGVDHLQKSGDTHDRSAADRALRHVADVLKEKIRASDKVFRCSGEEFLFLMPCTSAEGALIAVDRLREAVATTRLAHQQSPLGIITVSIGVASKVGGSWQVVLMQAENALTQAKGRGQNTVCCP